MLNKMSYGMKSNGKSNTCFLDTHSLQPWSGLTTIQLNGSSCIQIVIFEI